ncbi:MAG: holo-ACP synthase [Candidatus Omnitrophica bacterium]|nr:holo-ACP synthase [Candidatus Omnitrophota bacterium]
MIIGTGVDIIEVARVKAAVGKWGSSFLKKVFTEKEIKYSNKKRFVYQHLAARFATKEAVLKAFGGGWSRTLPWKDVEVINNKDGKPEIKLHREAKKLYDRKGIEKIIVSMSHTKEHAVANAILVKE